MSQPERPKSKPDPPLSIRERVERIAVEHHIKVDGKPVLNHRNRKRGCAWCVDAGRVAQAMDLMSALNPAHVRPEPRSLRFALAADDLTARPLLNNGGLLGALASPGAGPVFFGPPPPANADVIRAIADRMRRRELG